MIILRRLSLVDRRGSALRRLLHLFSSSSSLSPPPPSSPPHSLNPSSLFAFSSSFHGLSSRPPFDRDDCTNFTGVSMMRVCYFSSHAAVDLPASGIVEVPLAQTGEGIAECELLKWYVNEGDDVEEFQPLCEVQSDKATIEITSRYRGKVSEVLHAPGEIVKVGETLLKMVVEDSFPLGQGQGVADGRPSVNAFGDSTCVGSTSGVLCTPAVRSVAKEYGININDVPGTGKDGRVLKEDVLRYAAAKDSASGTSSISYNESVAGEGSVASGRMVDDLLYKDESLPLRGFQRAMVKSMTMAAKVPHFHYVEEIRCDELIKLKASFKNQNSDPNLKHTFLPFLVKSLSMALSKFPLMNSCFNEEMHEIVLKGAHNVGVAMATPYGLVVPNIKKVQSLSILEVTRELSRLQKLAFDNKLSPDDISGGTITLSNIGAIGGKFGSPLINLPEVAIIAIGRIEKVPWFIEDEGDYPAPVSIMNVNIAADHRVLDGAIVARFCNEWKLLIENPDVLLLHMR